MNKKEFSKVRQYLGKTQKQMAQLLGASPKAIQSFEQGWRKIPVHTERQLLFIMALKSRQVKNTRPCWEVRNCSEETRINCPAWELQTGELCWFINGTICRGKVQESWQKKMTLCRRCQVYLNLFQPIQKGGPP